MILKSSNKINRKNILIILFIILIGYFYSINFIKYYPIKSDAKDYFELSLNYKINNIFSLDDLNDKDQKPSIRRSPLYPFFLSFFISKDDVKKINTFEKCYEYEQKNTVDTICLKVLKQIQIFNMLTYFVLLSCVILFSLHLGGSYMMTISGFIFVINSFFLTKIMIVGPEILAALFFFVSSIFLYFFFNGKRSNNFFSLFLFAISLSLLILTKEIFLYTYPIIFFIILIYILKYNNHSFILKILIIFSFFVSSLLLPFIWQKHKLDYRNSHLNAAGYNESIATGVLSLRAVYSTLNFADYVPLFISFTPKIGNKILLNNFKKDRVYKFLEVENSGRNYYYNNRLKIFENILEKNQYNKYFQELNQNNANQLRSLLIIKDNFIKYILTIPIFLYRGLFPLAGISEYQFVFPDNLNKHIFQINKIINYSVNILSILSILILFLISLFYKNFRIFIPLLILPLLSFLYHASITHYIGRYSNILLPTGIICVSYFISFFINQFIKKNS